MSTLRGVRLAVAALAATFLVGCGGSSGSAPTTRFTPDTSQSACEAALQQPHGEDSDIITACRSAGFDPVWIQTGGHATAADYDKWRRDNFGVKSAATECSPPQRRVVYNGNSTAGYGDMTAQLPTGSVQQSPDLPIKLKSDKTPQGWHFCADPDQFLYISLQNPVDSGSISCTIEVDGQVVSSNTASGGFAIATCEA